MGVARDDERRLAGFAEQRERVRAQPRRLPQRANAPSLDDGDLPSRGSRSTCRNRDVLRAEREPGFAETQHVVEVAERVELNRPAAACSFNAFAQLARESRGLSDV